MVRHKENCRKVWVWGVTHTDFSFCETVVAGVFEAVGVGAHVDGDVAKNDDFLVEVLGVAF